VGLPRILDAMKRYGDTWGCFANTEKIHIVLVGPLEAAAEARQHDFGSSSLVAVDQVTYLGVCHPAGLGAHIAATHRKDLGAFHT
jgi:hypothetical protein